METAKNKMIEHLKKNGVEDGAIKYFEKEKSTSLKRNFRL